MSDDTPPSSEDGAGNGKNGQIGRNGAEGTDKGSAAPAGGKDGIGADRHLFEIRAPRARSDGVLAIGRRLATGVIGLLDWLLTHFTSPTVMSAVIGLGLYAYMNSDAVRVLPFEGNPDGTALAVQLSQMLDAVDRGARAGIDEGLDGFKCTSTKPPEVAIPGTGISLTSLVSWGQTQVQGELIDQGKLHRLRLQVTGPISGLIETDPKSSVDEAMVEGAERLYALLVPLNGAYYYFSRYPDRALQILQGVLDEGDPGSAVYRVWGLALRNLGDVDGALDAFRKADAEAKDAKHHAHIHVEMGYAARSAKRWDAAVDYFDQAAKEDPTWPVPVVRKADALWESGNLTTALGAYEEGAAIKPSFADAWVGIGHVYAAEGRTDLAIVAYQTARRFAFDPTQRASLLRDVGDVLFDVGCVDEAVKRYAEAMGVLPTYERERAKRLGGACPGGLPSGRSEAPSCVAFEPDAVVG
jgi:tetratricopeptide (TPR) repeat protein